MLLYLNLWGISYNQVSLLEVDLLYSQFIATDSTFLMFYINFFPIFCHKEN